MAVEVKLAAEARTKLGSAESRRLRRRGLIPANVYGHNEPAVSLTVRQDALGPIIQTGARIVDLSHGGKDETVMVREVQWDAFSREIYHIDLVRIDRDERVTLDVPLEIRGQAVGTLSGGHLEQQLRAVSIECTVLEIPDTIKVRVTALDIGQSIHVRDLEIPPGITMLTNADALVVQVVQATETQDEGENLAVPEPELIRKTEKEGEEA
jgi:large subunit ribosomal protein L25